MPKKDEAFVQGKQGLGQMAVGRKSLQSPHLNVLDTTLGCMGIVISNKVQDSMGKADMRASCELSVVSSASESEITKCISERTRKCRLKNA